jgi:hypothetical protein
VDYFYLKVNIKAVLFPLPAARDWLRGSVKTPSILCYLLPRKVRGGVKGINHDKVFLTLNTFLIDLDNWLKYFSLSSKFVMILRWGLPSLEQKRLSLDAPINGNGTCSFKPYQSECDIDIGIDIGSEMLVHNSIK